MQITATNVEPTALTLLSLSLYARGDPAFTLEALPTLPTTLAPGASVTLTAVDSPTTATGATKNSVSAAYTLAGSSTVLEADLSMSGGGD